MTITDTIRTVWKYLTKYMTPEGAAGVMGNLYAESGVQSVCLENLCIQRYKERQGKVYTSATYGALVDDGTISRAEFISPMGLSYAWGLAQWTAHSRKAALYDLCKSRKVSIGDLTAQLDYLMQELNGPFKSVLDVLTTTHDVRTASDTVLLKFEQPKDTTTAVRNKRYQYSMEVYNAMATTPAQTALKWMIDLANNPNAGYSQSERWGPNFDCSSAVISAYRAAGIPLTCTYTGNMKADFLKHGFKDVTASCNLTTGAGMLPGDVLLNEFGKGTSGNGHAAMYVGDGKMVHARGQSYGSSKTGDQGTEIAVTAYRNHPFELVLRYGETTPAPSYIVGECSVTMPLLLQGAVCNEVKTIQACLNAKGYKGKNGKALTLDGELGENTAYAVTQLQKKAGMKNINFGSVAKATWELILK